MPSINTNVAAIKARSSLDKVQRELNTSIARLSSGKRITRAHDDAAGSAIAGRMESQIRGLTMNVRTAKDGQGLVDTQEGAMQEISALLQRMRELAVQAGSGVVNQNTSDKDYLQDENLQLQKEILAIGANTKFNDTVVLTGAAFKFYTDIDVAGTEITTATAAMTVAKLGLSTTIISIGGGETIAGIEDVISVIDAAIGIVDNRRANLGAISNRFDHVIDNLTNVVANTEAARSRIEDADFSIETTQLTRNTILQQAATSMVAQANASKNMILALVQG
jgi:flagellin